MKFSKLFIAGTLLTIASSVCFAGTWCPPIKDFNYRTFANGVIVGFQNNGKVSTFMAMSHSYVTYNKQGNVTYVLSQPKRLSICGVLRKNCYIKTDRMIFNANASTQISKVSEFRGICQYTIQYPGDLNTDELTLTPVSL